MRVEFTKQTKDRVWSRCKIETVPCCEGIVCDQCGRFYRYDLGRPCKCGGKLVRCAKALVGRQFTFDHRNPDYFGKSNALENCWVLGWCCDDPKTSSDQTEIGKSRRLQGGKRKARFPFRGWRTMSGKRVWRNREGRPHAKQEA